MSNFLPPTWQEMLDLLTLTAKCDGFFERVTNLPARNNAVKTCLSHSFYRMKLLEWITFVKSKRCLQKSPTQSSKLRADGNEKFKYKDYASSAELFTESMAHALYNSKEMALAVANRSAALFYLGAYEECLKDIELALGNNYPESLKYKLYTRKAECMEKLNRYKEAIDAYNCALQLLKDANIGDAEEKELQIIMNKSTIQMKLKDSLSESNVTKDCSDVGTSGEREMKLVDKIPVVSHGESESFAYASAALSLRYNTSKGRHVVAKQDLRAGDIIFVEKPYAFVLLPDYCRQYCHHCCKQCATPIPCTGCAKTFYCGQCCRDSSWQEYHRYECSGGLELMHSVGIAHLALRVVLKADPLCSENSKFIKHPPDKSDCVESFGNKNNNYPAVYSLLPHIENMENDDFFQYALTATLLLIYLKESTEYFDNRQLTNQIESLHISDKSEPSIDFIGRLILRHIAQLICNAHAITKIESVRAVHNVTEEAQVRIATAIYPSASMMNHSCNPNIISSFYGEYVVVRASREIAAGSEVFNCYGPHFRRMPLKERQEILKSQYFFRCSCVCCTDSAMIEKEKHFSAWLCPQCSGPLISNNELENENKMHTLKCCCCRFKERADKTEHYVDQASDCYEKGVDAADNGDIEQALLMLKQCLSLREKYLYSKNADISKCLNQLARCCAVKGDFEQSVQLLKRSITMVEEQFGETSIELANELQKLSDVMLCCLKGSSLQRSEFLKKWEETESIVKKAKAILEITCGRWTNVMQDILDKEEYLKSLKPTAEQS
ncbi:SET and MYND domain-containing protein 4-like [Schistocerca gregaria]|uniref:SET and MYND domain-containing protein 4-like n=1 Tax=Schistocerca gregaria TaxID=7010 RepID=UPI00211DFC1A|nr:SET and MYND domain-containing protein 4-like [Schistocerca gregaria]